MKIIFLLPVCFGLPISLKDMKALLSKQAPRAITGNWIAPSESDVRAPCPMLNALANHGYIARSGREISKEMLNTALTDTVKLNSVQASFLVDQAFGIGYEKDNNLLLDLDALQKYVFLYTL